MTAVLGTEQVPRLEPLVYTLKEVGQLLRISAQHAGELVKRGVLPAVPNMGRRVLVPRHALHSYIEQVSA